MRTFCLLTLGLLFNVQAGDHFDSPFIKIYNDEINITGEAATKAYEAMALHNPKEPVVSEKNGMTLHTYNSHGMECSLVDTNMGNGYTYHFCSYKFD